jgi:hypothetical protein
LRYDLVPAPARWYGGLGDAQGQISSVTLIRKNDLDLSRIDGDGAALVQVCRPDDE